MLRGIGYVVARRNEGDPDESHTWALFIEAVVCRIISRWAGSLSPRALRRPVPPGEDPEDRNR
jgi:hypothetical protein